MRVGFAIRGPENTGEPLIGVCSLQDAPSKEMATIVCEPARAGTVTTVMGRSLLSSELNQPASRACPRSAVARARQPLRRSAARDKPTAAS
jgi:hypothetical protein